MLRHASISLLLLSLISCGDPNGPDSVVVTKVTVVGLPTLVEGETSRYTASLMYEGQAPSSPPRIEWTSSAPDVIAIDSTGAVTVAFDVTHGATITAKANGVSGSMDVSVTTASEMIVPGPAVLALGEKKTLTAYSSSGGHNSTPFTPESWSSDDPGIATVSQAGEVTPVKAGTTRIRAHYTSNNRSLALQSHVTVVPAPHLKYSVVSGGPFPEWWLSYSPPRKDRNCGISEGALYCWGMLAPGITPYDYCELAFTSGMWEGIQCATIPIRVQMAANFVSVSAGDGGGGCALTSDGDVYCFGLNQSSQLGVPGASTEIGIYRFVDHGMTRVSTAERFVEIFAESNQRCGIRANRNAFCWGAGFGDKPTQLSTYGWKTIAARGQCGIVEDNSLFCWSSAVSLKAVPLSANWKYIDVAEVDGAFGFTRSACALASTGELGCWIRGAEQSPSMIANTPGLVSLGNMPKPGPGPITADRRQTCGLTSAGDMYCIVVAGTASSATYTLEPLDLGVKLRSFSGNCGMGVDGKAYCWSWNSLKAVLAPGQ